MSECQIFNNYQKHAEEITRQINGSRNLDEKVRLAKELVGLEKELESCEKTDDPKCRLQRRIAVPARRKVAEMIFRFFETRQENYE